MNIQKVNSDFKYYYGIAAAQIDCWFSGTTPLVNNFIFISFITCVYNAQDAAMCEIMYNSFHECKMHYAGWNSMPDLQQL